MEKYLLSFTDEISKEINGTSHLSLLGQLENRFDNMNRGDIINILKRKSVNETENSKKIKFSNSYGCINYQPDMLLTDASHNFRLRNVKR